MNTAAGEVATEKTEKPLGITAAIGLVTFTTPAISSIFYRVVTSTEGNLTPTGLAVAVGFFALVASGGKDIGQRVWAGCLALAGAFSIHAGIVDRGVFAERGSMETGCFDAVVETLGYDLYPNSRGSCAPRAFNS